jgi:hypothetical protein
MRILVWVAVRVGDSPDIVVLSSRQWVSGPVQQCGSGCGVVAVVSTSDSGGLSVEIRLAMQTVCA